LSLPAELSPIFGIREQPWKGDAFFGNRNRQVETVIGIG
jgi:hypothetical protein